MDSNRIVVDVNSVGEQRRADSADGKTKEERALNRAIRSYARKFGLKYSNGKVSSPELDKKIKDLQELASSKQAESSALSEIVKQMREINSNVLNGRGPLNIEAIDSSKSIEEAQLEDPRINNGPLSPAYIQSILNRNK